MQNEPVNIKNVSLWEKIIKGLITGIMVLGIIISIVSFVNGFILGGVLSIIIIFITICVGTRWGEQISDETMKKVSIALATAMVVVSIVSIIGIQPITGSLNKDNFKRAFDCEFTATTSAYTGGDLYWEISPRTNEYVNDSRSSDVITVVVKYSFTGGTGYTQNVTIELYKSEGYKSKGNVEIEKSYFTYVNKSFSIVSVSGAVYK